MDLAGWLLVCNCSFSDRGMSCNITYLLSRIREDKHILVMSVLLQV
jgi:hypothetical protein